MKKDKMVKRKVKTFNQKSSMCSSANSVINAKNYPNY